MDHKPLEKLSIILSKTFYRLQEQMNIFDFTIHYKKGSKMPVDFLRQNVCEDIDVFEKKIQYAKLFMTSSRTWTIQMQIKNHSNRPKLRQISSNTHRNILYKILWIRLNKIEGAPRTVLFVPQVLKDALIKEAHGKLQTL